MLDKADPHQHIDHHMHDNEQHQSRHEDSKQILEHIKPVLGLAAQVAEVGQHTGHDLLLDVDHGKTQQSHRPENDIEDTDQSGLVIHYISVFGLRTLRLRDGAQHLHPGIVGAQIYVPVVDVDTLGITGSNDKAHDARLGRIADVHHAKPRVL